MSLENDTGLVEDLAAIEDGLNDWELEFVESVCRQVLKKNVPLSDKQKAKARQILEEKG